MPNLSTLFSPLFSLFSAFSKVRHLSQIASGIPLAEWLMLQIVRDPHTMTHAMIAVLVTSGVAHLCAGTKRGVRWVSAT